MALLTGAANPAFSQTPGGEGRDLHQIFLKEPAQEIKNVEYEDNGEPVDFELTPDGGAIILKNYNGQSRLKITLIHPGGREATFGKSRCYVDAFTPLL